MILNIIFVVVGVVLVLLGADRLTEGSASLARRMKVPEIVIGLTIVAAGTSAPEFFVSLVSALKGTSDMAVGNVVGSNIFNTMLIVGCAAMVAPMTISKTTVRKDIPFALIASLLLVVLCLDGISSFDLKGNMISRVDGVILLVGFSIFMFYTFRTAKNDSDIPSGRVPNTDTKTWKCLLYIVLGLAGLIVGSNLFVDAASGIAERLGISKSVIALTIVAGGTSLPELATSVVAARKGQSAIAIGNVIGSNVFNILAILGVTAVICPMRMDGITIVDMLVMLLSMLLVWLFSFTRYTVARWEGFLLAVGFLGYLYWLLAGV